MIEHFTYNDLFSKRLAETQHTPSVHRQLISIFRRAHDLGLDWYFTGAPDRTLDLRCGRKEISSTRATDVCFRIWIRNKDEFRVGGTNLTFVATPIPLHRFDIAEVFTLMESFANGSVARRPSGGFLPDQFIQSDMIDRFQTLVVKSLEENRAARLARLQQARGQPERRHQKVVVFIRNPDVVAESLYIAGGRCQRCKKKAPFLRRKDDQPYLEVHHIIPLIEGGSDTLDNVIALCPNCHREMHHGKAAPGANFAH